ncbi:MAG TPA: TraR/DksA C4-type zinc finger protein [Gemmatimonadaceae bacterium]|jgi:RNA polymerase-binding transcription factor DksA
MNAQRRRHFTRRLNEERARLASTLRTLESEVAVDVIEAAPERDASGAALSDAEAAEAAASVELEQLRAVDAAIVRLRSAPEQFGRCVVCGKEIGARRLELVPWAQHCIAHAAAPRHDAASLGREGPPILE